tara:strand:+ start:1559 stop:2530 length:972 start_codon:yes stop_codon:yes gene_type:complete
MKKTLLKYICCPECFGNFKVLSIDSKKEEIINGNLYCKKCDTNYPIIRGLPIILDKIWKMKNTKNAFSTQWKILSKGGFEKNTIYSQEEPEELNEFKKTFDIENWSQLNGKLILDAGCGSGRLTSNLAQKAKDSTVIGIDISDGAVIANELAMKSTNHHVVQCDINYLPFRKELFNMIWSQGVIHHTPNTYKSFKKLLEIIHSNGQIYILLYPNYIFGPYRFIRDIFWKSYLIPKRWLYLLCWIIALPLYLCFYLKETIFLNKKTKKNKTKLRTVVFSLFDNLAPEYQHRHSKAEVSRWFLDNKITEYKFVDDLGVVGRIKKD